MVRRVLGVLLQFLVVFGGGTAQALYHCETAHKVLTRCCCPQQHTDDRGAKILRGSCCTVEQARTAPPANRLTTSTQLQPPIEQPFVARAPNLGSWSGSNGQIAIHRQTGPPDGSSLHQQRTSFLV
jgi:hypothetical protein